MLYSALILEVGNSVGKRQASGTITRLGDYTGSSTQNAGLGVTGRAMVRDHDIPPGWIGVSHREQTTINDLSGDDLHRGVAMPAAYAIRFEVPAIDGEDSPRAQGFSSGDERCVGQVHRMIGV